MKRRHCLVALAAVVAAWLVPASAQEKARDTKVEIHLAAEHAPEGLKAGASARLMMVLGSTKTKTGKVSYTTRLLADGVEVVSVKREEKPADPNRAVRVELRATKAQVNRIEQAKNQLVTIMESAGGKIVRKQRPVPLRLELIKPEKE